MLEASVGTGTGGPLPHTVENNFNLNCQIRTVFPYYSLIIIVGKMGYFKVLDNKSIIKADSRLF